MPAAVTVDEYIAAQPAEIADRLQRIREIVVAAVADHQDGRRPEEKIRYGMPAVMLGGRYALHMAGWKKHIGLYPVPTLPEPLESETAPFRSEKDSVIFLHSREVPYDLIARVAEAVVAGRQSENA
jgi:uncharacterized protein YdhG (YjbR/CyaY superfamily)